MREVVWEKVKCSHLQLILIICIGRKPGPGPSEPGICPSALYTPAPHRPQDVLSFHLSDPFPLTDVPPLLPGLGWSKGREGRVRGERSQRPACECRGLCMSLEVLSPVTVMPLNPFLFHLGASWPTGPYWVARNQRREGNHLPLMPPQLWLYICRVTQPWRLNPCTSLVLAPEFRLMNNSQG